MDILTHIFLPLIFLLAVRISTNWKVLLFIPLAILPDLDVFLGIHRSLLHSLLIIVPLIGLSFVLTKKYYRYVAFFLSSHLFLDFLAGGVPFFYPLYKNGVGMEFPLIVKFASPPSIVEYLPRIVIFHPSPVHGQSYEVFSNFGVASMLLFLAIYYGLKCKKIQY